MRSVVGMPDEEQGPGTWSLGSQIPAWLVHALGWYKGTGAQLAGSLLLSGLQNRPDKPLARKRTLVLSAGFLRMALMTWNMGVMPVPPASMPASVRSIIVKGTYLGASRLHASDAKGHACRSTPCNSQHACPHAQHTCLGWLRCGPTYMQATFPSDSLAVAVQGSEQWQMAEAPAMLAAGRVPWAITCCIITPLQRCACSPMCFFMLGLYCRRPCMW